jgi:hypothetical protein
LQTDPEAVVVHITGAQSAAQFDAELAEAESEVAPPAPEQPAEAPAEAPDAATPES